MSHGAAAHEQYIAFVVPLSAVKTLKNALEHRQRQHATLKIDNKSRSGVAVVPSTFNVEQRDIAFEVAVSVGLDYDAIEIIECNEPEEVDPTPRSSKLFAVMQAWRKIDRDSDSVDAGLVDSISLTNYTVYGSLLLIPANTANSSSWLALSRNSSSLLLYVAERLPCTHIALNGRIPGSSLVGENIMRSPTDLIPLYGDFGPLCTTPPTPADLRNAFWTHTKQNSITQIWAPRYTMFSRGNITEKARILHHPSVAQAVSDGNQAGTGSSAVDLYAGIGYFAFSYLAAGVDMVLCWDINAWSIEGLRRAAEKNKWPVRVFSSSDEPIDDTTNLRALAFRDSNVRAADVVQSLRARIPPVRHVNCGLLPTSQGSWETAVRVLDPQLGGWLHLHENFATSEIEAKAAGVRDEIQRLANVRVTAETKRAEVVLEHVQRVKTYAPGVWHCVVDLFVPPAF